MKRALVFLIVLLVTPALPGVAGAHVEVTPSKVPAGKVVRMDLEVGHGCDGAATNRLEVLLPDGLDSAIPGKAPGWKAKVTAKKMIWTGGPLGDHDLGRFPFRAEFFGKKGSEQVFRIIQGCEGGATIAWIQQAPPGGAEPADPASVVTLTSSASLPAEVSADDASGENPAGQQVASAQEGEEDDGASNLLPIIGAVLIAASVTAFIVIQRGKRNRA